MKVPVLLFLQEKKERLGGGGGEERIFKMKGEKKRPIQFKKGEGEGERSHPLFCTTHFHATKRGVHKFKPDKNPNRSIGNSL